MIKWNVIMKTPGFLKENLFYLRTLVILSVLSIGLQTFKAGNNTSVENISGKNESLEIVVQLPSGEGLRLRATGATTSEVLMNLRRMLQSMDGTLLLEKS